MPCHKTDSDHGGPNRPCSGAPGELVPLHESVASQVPNHGTYSPESFIPPIA